MYTPKPYKTLLLAAMAVLGGLLYSCNKSYSGFQGTSLEEQFSILAVKTPLAVNMTTVDFVQNPTVIFTAQFNKVTDWTLILTGSVSKSSKTITGHSRGLDATNATWDGTSDLVPLFSAGDVVSAKLFFPTDTTHIDTLRTSLNITKGRNIMPNDGVLVSDFEAPLLSPLGKSDPNSQAADATGFKLITNKPTFVNNPAQGLQYYQLGGRDNNADYYIGGLLFPATGRIGGPKYFPLPIDSTGLWFNVFVYGDGKSPATQVGMAFYEDENNDGIYQSASEDTWSHSEQVTWTGWKLISYRYGSTTNPNYNGASTPGNRGNKKYEPSKVVSVGISLNSVPNGQAVLAGIDYPVFTKGGPLKP